MIWIGLVWVKKLGQSDNRWNDKGWRGGGMGRISTKGTKKLSLQPLAALCSSLCFFKLLITDSLFQGKTIWIVQVIGSNLNTPDVLLFWQTLLPWLNWSSQFWSGEVWLETGSHTLVSLSSKVSLGQFPFLVNPFQSVFYFNGNDWISGGLSRKTPFLHSTFCWKVHRFP